MIRIIALTEPGHSMAQTLQACFPKDSELWFKPQPFAEKVQQAFMQGDKLLFICATGIVVRTLAPVLNHKHQDPPVVVMDEQGQFVIPLLSGHQGGANQWAGEIAVQLGAQLVLTTAKTYLQPVYTLGMGCERHCPQAELTDLVNRCLQQADLSLAQVHSINSIDIKHDELGLIACAAALNKPYHTFDKTLLAKVGHLLSEKSDYVFNTVGVYGVAESAALVAAQQLTGDAAELVLTKIKTAKATCAIARSYF
ncbi:MAG: cobalamin biosynthesis protein [Cellvibrionaceae bacterium]|nr:cobalamin biosynthesis protein [Cellvibrionaceae bacterium]